MRLYKTDAIVLSDSELGDQDKIITLLSDQYGKIRGVAKGARRLKSRFDPAVRMLSYVTAVLYKSQRIEVDTCYSSFTPLSFRYSSMRAFILLARNSVSYTRSLP